MADLPIIPIERLAFRFAPRPWAFAETRRAEIEAHFEKLRRAKPALWNGRVLLMHQHAIEGSLLRGAYLETDYASFLAWRDWNYPDVAIRNCFGLGALRSKDGAFLLGVMAPHTANAGRIYFPGGTPDQDDIVGETVDLEGNVVREVAEETGLAPEDLNVEPGWHAVFAGPRIAMIKLMQANETAEALRAHILAYLASETDPELCDILIARGKADLHPNMPDFIPAFLARMWR
ncbi:MAG: NUDIX hydrolase [Pseudomonadota bacterium]|nr:NUDIX hydrolase [Pseudomonadota bacterium]